MPWAFRIERKSSRGRFEWPTVEIVRGALTGPSPPAGRGGAHGSTATATAPGPPCAPSAGPHSAIMTSLSG